ncbi:MAG TPA: hypothetical protein VKB53_06610 [Gammaproteobacteria bacterium]|jgi:ABC-type bacteriocin/lantibiotic exporter with double-glycine peptidase domain|nr:hypothetical protein [Gammaproteobacteria bacterium]
MDHTTSNLITVLVVLLFITVILWIFLPFAIFGTKKKLDRLIEEAKKSNASLQQLIEEVKMSQIADRRKNEEEEEMPIMFDIRTDERPKRR